MLEVKNNCSSFISKVKHYIAILNGLPHVNFSFVDLDIYSVITVKLTEYHSYSLMSRR